MSLIHSLITAYTNEKNTSMILPYKQDLVTNIQQKHKKQKNDTDTYKIIYEQEHERFAYFLQQYIKTRLTKIRKNLYISNTNYLSVYEKEFASKYIELAKKEGVYNNTTEHVDSSYVCFVVLCESKNVIMDGNEILMREGNIFVCALSDVQTLLLQDEIILM